MQSISTFLARVRPQPEFCGYLAMGLLSRGEENSMASVLPATGQPCCVFSQSTSLLPGAGLSVSKRQRSSNPQRTASMSKIAALADFVAAISF